MYKHGWNVIFSMRGCWQWNFIFFTKVNDKLNNLLDVLKCQCVMGFLPFISCVLGTVPFVFICFSMFLSDIKYNLVDFTANALTIKSVREMTLFSRSSPCIETVIRI